MPVGDEVKLRCRAPQAALTLRSRAMRLDFSGHCTLQGSAGLSDLHMTAGLPDAGGAEDGGTVSLTRSNGRFTAKIKQPGGTTEPAAAKAPVFDGSDHRYELSEPVEFVLEGDPGATILRIDSMALELERPT
jgi:hypothetical protein